MKSLHGTLTIAALTWREARRRRIVLTAALCGIAFVLVFAAAVRAVSGQLQVSANPVQAHIQLQFLSIAGIYVINFLTVAVAILLPVDTLSGEIRSGVMQTLAAKPVSRGAILLGKWLTYQLMTAAYLVLMAGGIALVMRTLTGYVQPNLPEALVLIWLGAATLSTITIAGGVHLTTITNGMVAFGFFGVAFIGGWIEQVGAVLGNAPARSIGTAISLLSPADAMWRRAAFELQPLSAAGFGSPFSTFSVPSAAMIAWAAGFVLAVLMLALIWFRRRAL